MAQELHLKDLLKINPRLVRVVSSTYAELPQDVLLVLNFAEMMWARRVEPGLFQIRFRDGNEITFEDEEEESKPCLASVK